MNAEIVCYPEVDCDWGLHSMRARSMRSRVICPGLQGIQERVLLLRRCYLYLFVPATRVGVDLASQLSGVFFVVDSTAWSLL